MSPAKKHLDLLDYTRAVAIISVVAYHCLVAIGAQLYWNGSTRDLNAPFSNLVLLPLNLGSLGVAIFFVVSGFCIHLSFQQQGKKYSGFFVRRFFRLYPAYLVCLVFFAFAFPKTSLAFSGLATNESWRQFISHLLFMHNFEPGTFFGINASFWSLAVEVQLYLLYPLLLLLVSRFGWKHALIILGTTEVLIHVASQVVLFNTISAHPFLAQIPKGLLSFVYGLSRSPLAWWFSWSLGALIADCYLANKPQPLAAVSPMIWVGCMAVCFLFRPLSEFLFMTGCLLTATILSRLMNNPLEINRDRFGWKFLSKVGVCSYSLYLLHQPILFAMPTAWLNPYGNLAKILFLGIVGFAILFLSYLFYIAIEAPGIKLGKNIIKLLKPAPLRADKLPTTPA